MLPGTHCRVMQHHEPVPWCGQALLRSASRSGELRGRHGLRQQAGCGHGSHQLHKNGARSRHVDTSIISELADRPAHTAFPFGIE